MVVFVNTRSKQPITVRMVYNKIKMLNIAGDCTTPDHTVQKVDEFKYLGGNTSV